MIFFGVFCLVLQHKYLNLLKSRCIKRVSYELWWRGCSLCGRAVLLLCFWFWWWTAHRVRYAPEQGKAGNMSRCLWLTGPCPFFNVNNKITRISPVYRLMWTEKYSVFPDFLHAFQNPSKVYFPSLSAFALIDWGFLWSRCIITELRQSISHILESTASSRACFSVCNLNRCF